MTRTRIRGLDLGSEHIGQAVRLTFGRTSIEGLLSRVEHRADLISDLSLSSATPDWVCGRRRMSVTVGGVDVSDIDADTVTVEVGA